LTKSKTNFYYCNADSKHGNKRLVLFTGSGASNLVGSINNLTAMGMLTKKYGIKFMVDAAQLVAHRRISM